MDIYEDDKVYSCDIAFTCTLCLYKSGWICFDRSGLFFGKYTVKECNRNCLEYR